MLERTTRSKQMEESKPNVPGDSDGTGDTVRRYSRLSVIAVRRENGRQVADCKCDCGTLKTIRLTHLTCGYVKSCGCLRIDRGVDLGNANTKHGHAAPSARSHTYRSWECARARCYNVNDPSYANYGGRGIRMCAEWDSYTQFLSDMGVRKRGKTLDRKDVDGDYTAANCRWATLKIQGRNKRNNRRVVFNGETVPLVVVAEQTGVPYSRLWERIVRRGWDVDKAVNTPSRGYN